jgi:Serine dehydrogenase proteinase
VPTYGELETELAHLQQEAAENPQMVRRLAPPGLLRKKYIEALSQRTERTTFLYYSGFMQNPQGPPNSLQVSPADMTGFMELCSNTTDSKQLDLFLHSPGGDGEAADQICAYLRTQFDHIRAIVPVYAMSAATMIALSADVVLMGTHSQLGPIDPQLTIQTNEGPRGASAQAIKDQFDLATKECEDPKKLAAWLPILRSYAPGLLAACDHATQRSEQIVKSALEQYMFKGEADAATKAADAAAWFGDAATFLSHGRPVRRDEAREHGIKVDDLEDDSELQDAVLSVHHAALLSMSTIPIVKLIENNRDRRHLEIIQTLTLAAGPVTIPNPPNAPGGPSPGFPPAGRGQP